MENLPKSSSQRCVKISCSPLTEQGITVFDPGAAEEIKISRGGTRRRTRRTEGAFDTVKGQAGVTCPSGSAFHQTILLDCSRIRPMSYSVR